MSFSVGPRPVQTDVSTHIGAAGAVTTTDQVKGGGHGRDQDALHISPRAQAARTASVYAETAGGGGTPSEKMAIFRERFAPNVRFSGPMFGNLRGRQVFGKLATEHAGGAKIEYAPMSEPDIQPMSKEAIAKYARGAQGENWHQVTLRWNADYELLGNKIHNEVTTQLAIDESGKIRGQTDSFDSNRWMDQAVPKVPRFIRHSTPFRKLANFALGIATFFRGS